MIRWVLSPVLAELGADGRTYRRAKLADKLDATRPGKTVKYVAVISDGQPGQINGWCLCLVRAGSFAALDADAELDNALDLDYDDAQPFLDNTPNTLGWNAAKMKRVRDRMTARGVDTTGLTMDTPLWQILARIGQAIQPGWSPSGTWVR